MFYFKINVLGTRSKNHRIWCCVWRRNPFGQVLAEKLSVCQIVVCYRHQLPRRFTCQIVTHSAVQFCDVLLLKESDFKDICKDHPTFRSDFEEMVRKLKEESESDDLGASKSSRRSHRKSWVLTAHIVSIFEVLRVPVLNLPGGGQHRPFHMLLPVPYR